MSLREPITAPDIEVLKRYLPCAVLETMQQALEESRREEVEWLSPESDDSDDWDELRIGGATMLKRR